YRRRRRECGRLAASLASSTPPCRRKPPRSSVVSTRTYVDFVCRPCTISRRAPLGGRTTRRGGRGAFGARACSSSLDVPSRIASPRESIAPRFGGVIRRGHDSWSCGGVVTGNVAREAYNRHVESGGGRSDRRPAVSAAEPMVNETKMGAAPVRPRIPAI